MKYICIQHEDGYYEIFVFPRTVDHDVMMDNVSRMRDHNHGQWSRVDRTPASAGFVRLNGECYGRSETLNLESDPERDTALLEAQMAVTS